MPNLRSEVPNPMLPWDGCLMESLEARVLLSGSTLESTEMLRWHGHEFEVMTDSWIVTLDDQAGEARLLEHTRRALSSIMVRPESIRSIGRGGWVEFTTAQSVTEDMSRFVARASPFIKGMEPNRVVHTDVVPNDPLFGEQWSHDNIGQFIPGSGDGTVGADIDSTIAWDTNIGSSSVIVAVIDTGVDQDHPDLVGNLWSNPNETADNGIDDDGNGFIDDVAGWDFGELDNNPDDVAGHGTAVAGTIGAVGNNGVGGVGVAWDVSILGLKIADQFGALSVSAIVGSHDYLTMMRDEGHNIVASNNSYGAFAPAFFEDVLDGFIAEKEAIQRFIDSGGVFVASAGNSANDNDEEFTNFPAAYNLPGIISVAATDNNDALAGFSSYGDETVDLGAPGVNIFTTFVGGGYGYISGTSFSAPTVAGAVALIRADTPGASAAQIRQVLINSSDVIPALQNKVRSGGRLNVAEALRIIGLDGPVVTAITPGPINGGTDTLTVTFNKAVVAGGIDALPSASFDSVGLVEAGSDGLFGTGDDTIYDGVDDIFNDERFTDATFSADGLTLTVTLGGTMSPGAYRLTLNNLEFKDFENNFLNGDSTSGDDEVYDFTVAAPGGDFEPNDTFASATPVTFTASGDASFTGITLGNGLMGPLDVDMYQINIPRGGLITIEVTARNKPSPSTLDSYLRLFGATGDELASNDQFNGSDSFIDFFVSTGGTYYVGVSGFPNSDYDPTLAGSGQTQSTGPYDLAINVELVDDDSLTFDGSLNPPTSPGDVIPDGGVLESTITVTDVRQLLDVDVEVLAEHEFVSDLLVSLISPAGTEVILADSRGGSGQDFGIPDATTPEDFDLGTPTRFDDEAATAIAAGAAPFAGTFKPDDSLSRFDGESALGDWTLRIRDQAPLSTGQLLGWTMDLTLENNIFGPFELNDTLATARTITGNETLDAFIGDGGFGTLDVDLFSLTVDSGASLTATVTPGTDSQLNTALRLFESDGDEITISNPGGSRNSNLQFIFPNGGTYYLGVSETSNVSYDPTDINIRAASQTTGDYSMTVSVSAGVSDTDMTLSGDRIQLGVRSNGAIGSDGTGSVFDGIEFLYDQSNGAVVPNSFFGAAASGYGFRNDATSTQLPFNLTGQSDATNQRVVGSGLLSVGQLTGGLRVERSISFSQTDTFAAFDVRLTNNTSQLLTGVSWMEGFNPIPGLNLDPLSSSTFNNVLNTAPMATARFENNTFPDGLTVALAAPSSDPRAVASIVDPTTIRDPSLILASPNDPDLNDDADGIDGLLANQQLMMGFTLGNVLPGETVTARYFLMFGTTPTAVSDLYASINDGTGTGHLVPLNGTFDGLGDPADDANGLATLPYSLYYPDGFANDRATTKLPMLNPHSEATRALVVLRYEADPNNPAFESELVLFDGDIAANSRANLTISDPDLYAAGTALRTSNGVLKDRPYAIEVRSERPVAATFNHADFGVFAGEQLTSRTSDRWTFSSAAKGTGIFDFLTFYNTTSDVAKITTTFLPVDGSSPVVLTQTLQANRRGGWNLQNQPQVPTGEFGVLIEAPGEIVASLSHFGLDLSGAGEEGYGVLGSVGLGSLSGSAPEGQLGLGSESEVITILNANAATASVTFSFLFANGTSYRQLVTVPGSKRVDLDVATLPSFPVGQPYSVLYESDVVVSATLPTLGFGDSEASAFADEAHSLWLFSEGFRPAFGIGNVTEYLRLYNPGSTDVLAEITFRFTDGSVETFRRTLTPRAANELNVHPFITGQRSLENTEYSISVKASSPIVAYMGRADEAFNGSFGTLGSPLGVRAGVV